MTPHFVLLLLLSARNCASFLADGNVVPQNVTAKVNQSAQFKCKFSHTSKDVHWFRDSDDNYIYDGEEIVESLKQRYSVNNSSGESTLIISPVTPGDARKYICGDGGFGSEQFSAFLIVLEDDPSCRSNMGREGFIGPNGCGIRPDVVALSCTIKFHGGIPPELVWKKTGGYHTAAGGNTTIVPTGNSVTYTLQMEASVALNNSSYYCQTTQLTGDQLHCQSGFINVMNLQNNQNTLNKSVGDEVTCSSRADKNCTYLWQSSQSNGSMSVLPSSGGNQKNFKLVLENSGIYNITKVCNIRGVLCATPPLVVNANQVTEKKWFLFLLIPLAAVVAAAAAAHAVIARVRRVLQRRRDANCVVFDRNRLESIKTVRHGEQENSQIYADQPGMADEPINEVENSAAAEPLLKPPACDTRQEADERNVRQHGVNMDTRNSYKLIKTIRTKAAEKENTPIYGLAILGDELFIATGWSSVIEAWKLDDPTNCRLFEVQDLVRPFDLVSCTGNECLYIFDFKGKDVKSKEIIRVSTYGTIITRWCIGNVVCQSLSVTDDFTVILASFDEDVRHILEYSRDGALLRSIKVIPDTELNRILHVIKVQENQFIISHGSIKFNNILHRVCVVNSERSDDKEEVASCVKESFGGERGSSETKLCVPMHLAVKGDGTILVADRENSRVLLLSWPHLTFIREQIPKTETWLRKAFKLCWNESRSRLFVVDNAELPTKKKWGDGRILVFEVG